MSLDRTLTLAGRFTTLTPLSMDDVDALVEAANEDRSAYGWTTVAATTEEMAAAVAQLLVDSDALEAVPFATRDAGSGRIVGMTRFLSLRWWFDRPFPDAAEIGGTFLAASAQRTRVNTEAKLLMLAHAFDDWGVQRVDLKTDERNERSRRAIERLGARLDGVLPNWQPSSVAGERGSVRSSAMYSIVPEQWPRVREQLEQRLG